MRDRQAGFTFIELLASLTIMATLLLIAVPMARTTVQRHKEVELRSTLAQIRTAIDRYKKATEQGRIELKVGATGYPPDLLTLAEGVEDIASPTRQKMYFLRRIPADPFYAGPNVKPEETWGLRSYESPPEEPTEGDDVFDVYSRSEGVGLNGVAYREW